MRLRVRLVVPSGEIRRLRGRRPWKLVKRCSPMSSGARRDVRSIVERAARRAHSRASFIAPCQRTIAIYPRYFSIAFACLRTGTPPPLRPEERLLLAHVMERPARLMLTVARDFEQRLSRARVVPEVSQPGRVRVAPLAGKAHVDAELPSSHFAPRRRRRSDSNSASASFPRS